VPVVNTLKARRRELPGTRTANNERRTRNRNAEREPGTRNAGTRNPVVADD
jgi:hypothetical protein